LGLLRERQAELAERKPGRPPRPRVGPDVREEAIEHGRLDPAAAKRPPERAADARAPPPGHRDTDLRQRRIREETLLRRATLAHETVEALGVELPAAGEKPRLDVARERHVDVVAAEEKMVADRDALDRELPPARARRDEREVR